jgi:hypothetical protein
VATTGRITLAADKAYDTRDFVAAHVGEPGGKGESRAALSLTCRTLAFIKHSKKLQN